MILGGGLEMAVTADKNRSGRRTTHPDPFPLPLDICFTIFSQLTIPDLLSLRQVRGRLSPKSNLHTKNAR
jgi:hypothetical protein